MGEVFMTYHSDPLIRDYNDRGMAKWIGFYLSEHTAEMSKDEKKRNKINIMREAMSQEAISEEIEQAFLKRQEVNIQLAELTIDGQLYDDKIGFVEGYQNNEIFLLNRQGKIEIVQRSNVNNAIILGGKKWSELV